MEFYKLSAKNQAKESTKNYVSSILNFAHEELERIMSLEEQITAAKLQANVYIGNLKTLKHKIEEL